MDRARFLARSASSWRGPTPPRPLPWSAPLCGGCTVRRLQPLFSAQPALLLHVMANMADRIAHLAELVADLSLHTVEVRLARLLLESAADGTLERQAWLTQAELAARLGTVPDVLSRALRILADGGLIRFDRRQITILDRPGLLQRAQLAP